ncbi:Fe-S cluster assembly protein SufD [Gephyromycinifex aptenodytis]|uniref:Fe-S cluster assembly protein SufD n=1 Tax=Gephyromycinifex aptenodytis TaxID=2716227 RepID=UPI0014453C3E|nr:Fe-S cluster assembly protein SufD [Gephyromycinifex aptenodytis]
MPLIDKTASHTATGLPVSADDQALLGTPGKGVAAENVRAAVEQTIPEQSRGQWSTSFDVDDFTVPGGREEAWRFTPVNKLQHLFEDAPGRGALQIDAQLPPGVVCRSISRDEWRAAGVLAPADRSAAVTSANSEQIDLVDIPAEAVLTEPVRIRLTGQGGVAHSTRLVRVGAFAKATILLEHDGLGDVGEFLTVIAGDSSDVTIVSAQEWEHGAVHVGQHDVVVGRDASVRHVAVSLGGELVRLSINATYAGPGGSFEALGVYFADAGQHLEHRLFVDHEATNCRSNVLYKGALQGQGAHTVWVGDVLIRAVAEGTDTYELNRNLLLTEGARADSVPNLEIETGEIAGAGHASATGRFDDEQLFYLQARGIPEDEARRLVVRGFFADIVGRIGVKDITDRLMTAIEAELTLTESFADGSPRAVDQQEDA